MSVDTTSPGFVVQVISMTPEIRIQGRSDPEALGQILDRMTDVTERVLSFTYEDSEEDHDILRLRVDNHDLYFLEHPAWVKGNLVRFFFGYPGRIFGPRFAVVDGFRGWRELSITCVEESALANEGKNRCWPSLRRHEVVGQMVTERLFPGVTAIVYQEVPNEEPREWQQSRQSDWQFVQHLAEEPGFAAYIEGNTLFFHERRFDRPPRRRFEYFFGLGDLIDIDIQEWRVTDRAAEVTVAARNPISRENVSHTGNDTNTSRNTLGNQNTLTIRAGEGGALQVTEQTATANNSDRPAGSEIHASPNPDQAAVRAEADSRFRRQEQDEIEATALIVGDPLLPAKSVVEIGGLSGLSGKYYVKKHVHTMDGSGYRGRLTLIRNAVSSIPSSSPPTLDATQANENVESVASPRTLAIRPGEGGALTLVPGAEQ